MKPNFALLLSFEGIGLLHRSGQAGWHLVGEVPLDSDDLGEDLAALRSKALALDPSGLSTKLIIPDEQIRYMDLPAPRDDDQDLAVREALEGATPYHVDDLSYDWSLSDGRLYIAAVASETLDEAESFAVEHRFNPVSFVARPETDIFVGEPFFGAAAQARDVERDTVPVQILGRARMPEAPDPAVSAQADKAKPVVASKAPPPAPTPDPEPEPQDTAPVPTFSSIRGPLSDPGGRGDDLEPGSAVSGPSDEATPKELPALRNMATASLAPVPKETTADPDERSSKPVRPSQTAPGVAPVPSIGPTSQTAAVSPAAEAERLTIFGARREAAIGGKPRFLGLILTAILLLFLIGVAAFATIFSNQGFSGLFGNSEPAIALTPAPEPAPEPAQATDQADRAAPQLPPQAEPQPEVQPAPDSLSVAPDPVAGQTAADPVSEADDRGAPLDNDGQAEPAPEAEPAYLAEARRLSRYAATGIWHEPPEPPAVPDAGSVDDIYQTSIDVAVDLRDAVALPAQPETRSDRRPATPPAPVEAGTTFNLDQRGLVIATPDGALTPAGVPVRSGPPPASPPEVPPRAVPLADGALDAETAAELTRLGGIRPRSRPEDLIEQQERGALAGRTRSELAALRPRVRPQVPDRETAAADPDARAASLAGALLQAQPEAEAEADAGDEVAILPQAVDTSAKPRQRPAAVERAAAQSAATAVPAAASAAPRIPTRASVARQATATNAINLRNVNLIGVYGTRQDRRALVRLSSGRYQKVKVGDRLDGGRVLAIGDAELRYNRRGRNVVLRLPKG